MNIDLEATDDDTTVSVRLVVDEKAIQEVVKESIRRWLPDVRQHVKNLEAEIANLRAENTVMTAKLKAVTDCCTQHQAVATNWDVEQLATVGGYNTALVRILDLLATFDASDPEATDA